jgi:hypothetical protein
MNSPTPSAIPQLPARPAGLVSLAEKDVAEVAAFIALQSGRTKETVEAHLRWFLLENPARQPHQPLGFGLRSDDRLVGCIFCSPQMFQYQNNKILLMGSSSFYVDQLQRGSGGRIFLQYCRLGNQYPLFGTSANPESASLWKAAGARPIPYSDGELFGVLHWPPIVEEFAHRQHRNRLLSRLAGSRISGLAGMFRPLKLDRDARELLQLLTSPQQLNDLLIQRPSRKLTAARDLPYMRWRYFSGRDATVAVFAFRCRHPDPQVLVTVNQRIRGYRGQINTLNLLDVYPEVSTDEYLRIAGALVAHYRGRIDALVLRGQNPEQQMAFCHRGFQRRAFDAPNGWLLDRCKLLPTNDWHIVPADGDGLI